MFIVALSFLKSRETLGEWMKRFNSIKKNSDFQVVYKTGKSYANKLLVMYVKRTGSSDTRIGISVSKKVGNSVVRHTITRLLRECYRLNKDTVKTGLDIVVVVRAAARASSYKNMESAYLHLCGIHNILENRSEKIDKKDLDKNDSGISEVYISTDRTSL